jgi:hypothetical protein
VIDNLLKGITGRRDSFQKSSKPSREYTFTPEQPDRDTQPRMNVQNVHKGKGRQFHEGQRNEKKPINPFERFGE